MATKSRPLALEPLAQAFEAGRYAEVIELAEAMAREAPRSPEPLRYLAAALVETGDLEKAAATYTQALRWAPRDSQLILGASEQLICIPGEDRALVEKGLSLAERGRVLARKAGDSDLQREFLLLAGIACNQLGDGSGAMRYLDEALALDPSSVDATIERSVALFELCRFDESRGGFEEALGASPDEPAAHHYLGLLAERRGDAREMTRRFERARALAPVEFPLPVNLSERAFDGAVEAAVLRLPEHVKAHLHNTTIAVERVPSDEDLLAESPPLSPLILGVFRGLAVGERSVMSAEDHFPTAIVLYQRNLERFARTTDELIEQIGITLMHEVGHLMGLDEEDLWERGLE